MNGYAIAGVALVMVGIGAVIVMSNKKKRAVTQRVIREVGSQFDDGVITQDEAPGLANLINTGRIHTSDYRHRRGRENEPVST